MTGNISALVNRAIFVGVAVVMCLFLAHLATAQGILDIGLFVIVVAVAIACFLPRVTIIGILVLGYLPMLFPLIGRFEDVFGINLHSFDPLLMGVFISVLMKGLPYMMRRFSVFPWGVLVLLAFFVWMATQLGLTFQKYGAFSAIGECRTYYGCVVMVLYVMVHMNTAAKRFSLLRWVLFVCLFNAVLIIAAAVFVNRDLASIRVVSATITLGMVYGLVGLIIFREDRLFRVPALVLIASSLVIFGLIILPLHRSILMALIAAVSMCLILRQITFKHQVMLGVSGLMIVAVAGVLVQEMGQDPVMLVAEESKAFYAPTEDGNAYWRLYLWEGAVRDIRAKPLMGYGFGKHFQLAGAYGGIIMTSPHNAYITIAYQMGFVGLGLYLLFVVFHFFHSFSLLRRDEYVSTDQNILRLGLVVLSAAHVYFLAYSIELNFATWTLIGLAVSVACSDPVAEVGNSGGTPPSGMPAPRSNGPDTHPA